MPSAGGSFSASSALLPAELPTLCRQAQLGSPAGQRAPTSLGSGAGLPPGTSTCTTLVMGSEGPPALAPVDEVVPAAPGELLEQAHAASETATARVAPMR